MPELYIISGCNGSGKTTASYTLLPELLGCREFVNSDEFAKSLSPFNPSAASVAASRFMAMKIDYLLDKEKDFCIETTLATRSLVNIIRLAKDRNYNVTVLYFWLDSPERAIERVKARVEAGGHNIPGDTVRRRYYMGLKYLFSIYMKLCDRWILANNSSEPLTIVAEGSGNSTLIKDNETYKIIWKIIHPDEQP